MSLNLGNPACNGIRSLAANPDFIALRTALLEQAQMFANRALDASPDMAAMSTGYARAMRDVYVSIEAAALGKKQNQVEAPGVTKTSKD